MMRNLLKCGAPVGCIEQSTGNNEAHILGELLKARFTNPKVVDGMKLLLKYGIDPWQRNSSGASALDLLEVKQLEVLKAALKKNIKGRAVKLALSIESEIELVALFYNQEELSKNEICELLKDGTPAKKYFEKTLRLPSIDCN